MTPQKIISKWMDLQPTPPREIKTICFYNPEEPVDKQVGAVWWNADGIYDRVESVQAEMMTSPRPTIKHKLSLTELNERTITKGDIETAQTYSNAETDIQRVGILLLGAYVGRYNKHVAIPDTLPSEDEAIQLKTIFMKMAKPFYPQYSLRAVSGIPVTQLAPAKRLTLSGLLDLLISEAVEAAQDCQIVQIQTQGTPTLLAADLIEKERVEKERQDKKSESDKRMLERLDLNAMAFEPTTVGYLLSSLWSQPQSQLTKKLKINRSSLERIINQFGIPVPGQGFWAQVKAGKRPHPEGTPDFTPNYLYTYRDRTGQDRYERKREDDRSFYRETTMARPQRTKGKAS